MAEWAKVVIYPLGLCGFALYLLYMIHIGREKQRARGVAMSTPVFLYGLAGMSLVAGLVLAFVQSVVPIFTTGITVFGTSHQESVSDTRDDFRLDQSLTKEPMVVSTQLISVI
jgi:hypothetical protein